jgi:hypothetical protein
MQVKGFTDAKDKKAVIEKVRGWNGVHLRVQEPGGCRTSSAFVLPCLGQIHVSTG